MAKFSSNESRAFNPGNSLVGRDSHSYIINNINTSKLFGVALLFGFLGSTITILKKMDKNKTEISEEINLLKEKLEKTK